MKLPKLLKWIFGLIFLVGILGAALIVVAVTAYATKHIWDSRYRTYQTLYSQIAPGMSRAAVEKLIADHYPAAGKRQPPKVHEPTSTSLVLLMNPEHSNEPNAESIRINFKNDTVVDKRYTAD